MGLVTACMRLGNTGSGLDGKFPFFILFSFTLYNDSEHFSLNCMYYWPSIERALFIAYTGVYVTIFVPQDIGCWAVAQCDEVVFVLPAL